MTLTLTLQTEARLLARAEDEGRDVNVLADALLADALAHDEAESAEEPIAVTDEGAMSEEMRAAAKMLADFAREAEPAIKKYLYSPLQKVSDWSMLIRLLLLRMRMHTCLPITFGPHRTTA